MKENLIEIIYIEYITMLYIEFCNSQGIDYSKESMESREKDFADWLVQMTMVKKHYASLVGYMLEDSELVGELGKGKYNSVVPNLNESGIEALAITDYIDTFEQGTVKGYSGRIMLNPISKKAEIKYESPLVQKVAPNINGESSIGIDTLITHLPIIDVKARPLILSSAFNNDIAIGTYGFIGDKDFASKIRRLQQIKESIESLNCVNCDEEYTRENGEYLYLLKSSQKTLTRGARIR